MIGLGIHHISFSVQDLDRSRHFYAEVLGFEEIERPDFPFPGAWYRVGEGQVHLIVAPPSLDTGRPPAALNPLGAHSAFAIEDYAKVREHFRSRDIEVLETSPEAGQMWVRDPDGHLLEFIVPPRR